MSYPEDKKDTSAAPQEESVRPRLWQFRSGAFFTPGWTGNELIDARHERDLRLDGAAPALRFQEIINGREVVRG